MDKSNWNGFYDLSSIKDIDTLKSLFRDALEVAYAANIDHLPGGKFGRENITDGSLTIREYIETEIDLYCHNVVINRSIDTASSVRSSAAEIGSSTRKNGNKYLFIFVSLKHLDELVERYNIKPKYY